MTCLRCKGLTVSEPDSGYSIVFHIYQNRCLNCGHVMFDPKTVDSVSNLTKEGICV